MRWPVRSLVVAAFSLASISGAATLDFSDLLDSDGTRSAAFGSFQVSQAIVDGHPGRHLGWPDWFPENGFGRHRGNEGSFTSETFGISFDAPLFVSSIDVSRYTDRGRREAPILIHIAGPAGEDGFDLVVSSGDADANGNLNISVNRFASSISFVPTAGILSDFSLARVTIDETLGSLHTTTSPIPEPSSVVMLLIGGALVATQLRKLV